MKYISKILQPNMTGKLLILNMVIFLMFGFMAGIMLVTFRNIDTLMTTTVAGDLDQIIDDARMGWELSRVFARANLLLGTFYREPDVLKGQGSLLAGTTEYLSARSADAPLQHALNAFLVTLHPLLEQCAAMNTAAHKVIAINDRLLADLAAVEEINSKGLLTLATDGEDTSTHEQLAILILLCREDVLKATIRFSAFDPLQTDLHAVKAIIALLDNIHLKLRAFVASEPEVVPFHLKLYDGVVEYKAYLTTFDTTLLKFRKRVVELNIAKEGIEMLMGRLDQQIIAATEQMYAETSHVLHTSSRSVYGASGLAMLGLAAATYFFFVFSIHRPMKAIGEGVRLFGEGHLHTPIRLARTDDWNVIERALNRMAADLGTSINTLEREVSERKRAETNLRKTQTFLNNILNSMPSVIMGVDAETRVIHWNKATEQQTGRSAADIRNHALAEVYPDLSSRMDMIERALRERTPQKAEKQVRHHQNTRYYEDILLYPLATNDLEGLVIRIDDVTARVQLEEVMTQADRMVTIGGLAAGMAHEINNPLGIMLQGIQNIQRRLSPELPANQRVAGELDLDLRRIRSYLEQRNIMTYLQDMREAGLRVSHIVETMLSFSRDTDSQGTRYSIPSLLEQTLELAANDYDLKKKCDFQQIEIVRRYEEDLPMISCGGSRIQQVFLSLLKNGAQAMTETPVRPPRFILRIAREETMMRIEIEDNGPGLSEEIRKRVFEPFFTTKPPDIGTGLGLAVSYFIITEHHGGTIGVESTPGERTTFIIRLPLTST